MTTVTKKNHKKDRLDRIEETLRMAAAQTAENAKQIAENAKQIGESRLEFQRELKATRDEHNREMREIRQLLKRIVRRIAV